MRRIEVVSAPAISLTTTYSAGSALSYALSIWARHFLFFFGVSFLANLPMGLSVPRTRAFPGQLGVTIVSVLVSGILGLVVKGLVTFSVLEQLRGRRMPLVEALAKGWSRFGLLFSAAFSAEVLLGVATAALVVPGIIMSVQWALLSAVIAGEGDVDARGRSEQLTAGHRWSIFGLMTLFWVSSAGLAAMAQGLFGSNLLTETVPDALVLSFSAVVYSVIYYQLRSEKEGVDIEQLTSVFR